MRIIYLRLVSLSFRDSLAKICDPRNIDLGLCDARLQDRETNTETLLSFQQDTGYLVGKHVRITGKFEKH